MDCVECLWLTNWGQTIKRKFEILLVIPDPIKMPKRKKTATQGDQDPGLEASTKKYKTNDQDEDEFLDLPEMVLAEVIR